MCGNSPKCLMMVANKGSEDLEAVTPENFQHDFVTNGIFDKANVTLHEISKIPQNVEDSDYDEGGEGGEDENEEMDNGSMDDNQINDVEPKEVEEEPEESGKEGGVGKGCGKERV